MTSITEIADRLYMGSHPGERFPGAVPEIDLWVVAAHNEDPADRAPLLRQLAPAVLHLPLRDNVNELDNPRMRRLARAAAAMVAEAHRSGLSVLVTCTMGLNRSGLIVALTLVRFGYRPSVVIDTLRERRSRLVLSNSGYERYVRSQQAGEK